MAYIVYKKVKGREYAYLQRSYRAGTRVKTESVYLGRVAPQGMGVPVEFAASAKAAERKRQDWLSTPKGQEWLKEVETFKQEWAACDARQSVRRQTEKAQKAYDDLREQNQRELRDYWQKVEEHNARDAAASAAWKAEHASSDAPQPQASQSDAAPEE